jgi:tellurite resistance protein
MAEKDKFAQREHWLEEKYFGRKNQELIEKLRERREREADRQKMAQMMGVDDQEVLEALQDLGYTSETIMLLHIVPLVEVAWAEGGAADRERKMIFKIAEARGVRPDSVAHEMLSHWLENKPSERFFENSLRAIRVVFDLLPEEQRLAGRKDLIAYCAQIASAVSSGIFGPGGISDDERALIEHIASEIGQGREETVRKVIER